MKIGFDISDLATGRADGTTRYTYELAKRLPALAPEHEWLFFSSGQVAATYHLELTASAKLLISSWPKYWTQLRLPWDLYRYCPDVLFMPIQQIPYLLPGRTNTVSTVHDLAVHKYPRQFRYKDWLLLHIFTAYVARQADQIIAVSGATAADIQQYYGRKDNVHTINHGVDHQIFRPAQDNELAVSRVNLLQHYPQLQAPYLLYVGQLQPRKNITGLVAAFEKIAGANHKIQLVIAGGHGWLQGPIRERINRSLVKRRIHLLGVVPDELLVPLYWHAALFVFPGLYEGFGMVLLEALACGCPVVTSNVSSLPEVIGDAGILVDPNNTDDIAAGITKALNSRNELIQRGLKKASQFSWDATARKTLEVILRA